MMLPSTPPSSRISRSAASAALSPGSTCPFGKIHCLGSFFALTRSTSAEAPCPRTTTAPAWWTDGNGERLQQPEPRESGVRENSPTRICRTDSAAAAVISTAVEFAFPRRDMLTAIALDSEMTARAVLRRLARNGLWLDPAQADAADHIREQRGPSQERRASRRDGPSACTEPGAVLLCDPAAARRQHPVVRAARCGRPAGVPPGRPGREAAGRPQPARTRQPSDGSCLERRIRPGRRRRPRRVAADWRRTRTCDRWFDRCRSGARRGQADPGAPRDEVSRPRASGRAERRARLAAA